MACCSLFLILFIGASILIPNLLRLSLLKESSLLKLTWLPLVIFVPRNRTESELRLVSFVLVGLRVRPIDEQNSSIFLRISRASILVPLIPIIQSSAYLTYTSFLYVSDPKSIAGAIDLSAMRRRIFRISPSLRAFRI